MRFTALFVTTAAALGLAACAPVGTQQVPTTLIPGTAPVQSTVTTSVLQPQSIQTQVIRPQIVPQQQQVLRIQPQVQQQVASVGQPVTQLDASIIGARDSQLSGDQIRSLLAGRTLLSQRFSDPNDKQVGTFFTSGQMAVVAGGQSVSGNWEVEGNTVCYLLSGSRFCSTLHQSARSLNGQPLYYFRRANGAVGEPTVVVYSIQ